MPVEPDDAALAMDLHRRELRSEQDARLARQMQQDGYGHAPSRRSPSTGPSQHHSLQRFYLVCWVAMDAMSLFALLLQLTPPGLPHSMDELTNGLPTLVRAVWFVPLAIWAGLFPVGCGVIAGALLRLASALWVYGAALVACIAFRIFLVFEMSRHEGASEQTTIVIDMLVATVCVFVQLGVCDAALRLALDLSVGKAHARLTWARQVGPPSARATSGRQDGAARPAREASSRRRPASATTANGRQAGTATGTRREAVAAAPAIEFF